MTPADAAYAVALTEMSRFPGRFSFGISKLQKENRQDKLTHRPAGVAGVCSVS